MTMLVEIRPETEAELMRQAASRGLEVQAYAAHLLEAATETPMIAKTLDAGQLDATLHEIGQFTHKIPLLSDEAISRDSIYADYE